MALSPGDPSSFSRPEDVLVTKVNLDLDANFDKHILKGKVTLSAERKNPEASTLVLDTRDITVHEVKNEETKEILSFSLDKPTLTFGSKLEIRLPSGTSTTFSITIDYETSPNCTALQWLTPGQTAGKKHPYLFSQCQAIHARSMVPCQDTPAVKTPYTAQISSPVELVALMSAVKEESHQHPTDSSKMVHNFTQKIPIPSYLIAIVVAALESRVIGPRSKVWSEKEMIEAAAYEFGETEKMIATAEELLGPYVWGVYDLLVLPPSFPYGGMENPCLTFVTPTLLAGDRSLALVVAHEISHSWTGNLVTNKSPEHFWLNEGHTVFAERKIAGKMHDEKFRHFEAIGGWKDLAYQVDLFGKDHEYTKLVPNLTGVDPDDAFSTVPYEKGSNLLMFLEQKLGGPKVFEPFLKAYIEKFQYQSITTDDWKRFLYSFFSSKKSLLDQVNWKAWLYESGMPPVKPDYDTSLVDACAALAKRWVDVKEDPDLAAFSAIDLKKMSSYQIREFLSQLIEQEALTKKKIKKMDEIYNFTSIKNAEIKFRWLRLCLKAKCEDAIPQTLQFVNEQGRMKFVRPLYRDLNNWDKARPLATANYTKFAPQMHILTATMVGKDLNCTDEHL